MEVSRFLKLTYLVTNFVKSSLVAQMVKNLPVTWETQIRSLGWEDPLEKRMVITPVFLPGKFQGQKSLTGYSPWGHRVGHD